MGLARLWWIPAGMGPARARTCGTRRADRGRAGATAARRAALVIGEDLGTVEPWLRHPWPTTGSSAPRCMVRARADGSRAAPRVAPRRLATVGTHDMPPAAAFLTGEQVTLRAKLGLLTGREPDARPPPGGRSTDGSGARPRGAPGPAGDRATPDAVHRRPVRLPGPMPAMLVGVSLAEAAGERRPQNMPGTVDEYPNWRIPLAGRWAAGPARGPARARRDPGRGPGRGRRPGPERSGGRRKAGARAGGRR